MSALEPFHPHIQSWFRDRFAAPTDVQAQSWPRIAGGEHLVITAPTGSGKTLTAFLWAIDSFLTGAFQSEATRVLYISPLKALNNDIRRNLIEPIGELRERFERAGEEFPRLVVQTRSGDTEQSERQRMLRRPPELLITTPESLMLLLTTVRGRQALSTVQTVILDEVHSIVENRRGAQLMVNLERLAEIAGEFQRIALSATVNPLEAVAMYIGGTDAKGKPRPVGTVRSQTPKRVTFTVRYPEEARHAADDGLSVWDAFAPHLKAIIDGNRSTLLFANSRRMAEKVTLKINEHAGGVEAYAHHGSLSREIRGEVEGRLKAGSLKAIVATSSLEMGIDIGDLDEVVLIQSPMSMAATIQRIGRAGHRVGETSKGTLFPTFALDFVLAAAVSRAVREGDIEPLRPITGALDVLAQIIISAVATEVWDVDALLAIIRRAAPYAELERDHYQLIIDMLAGRYAGTRVRDLRPRIAFDRVENTITARKGAVFALYNSGGTIPDRGYFTLRHAETGSVIGELDEEFVWESAIGETFTLGSQNWRVERITHNDVLVKQAPPTATATPFWRAETQNRSHYFASRIGEFLEAANEHLAHRGRADLLEELTVLGFEDIAGEELVALLERQRRETSADLPHRNHLLIEHVLTGPGGHVGPDREQQVILHTHWGGQVNRPIALALEGAWRERFDSVAEIHADNHVIVVQVKDDVDPELITMLVTPTNFEPLLRGALEGSGFFGARFRECAGRSLLITKKRFDARMPLWMTRLQAKKLMTAVKPLTDFPVMLETWRTCLVDEFDMEAALAVLHRLHSGDLPWTLCIQSMPSPFASDLAFNQIGRYMYADDTPEQAGPSLLSDDLIRQAVFDASLRPRIAQSVIDEFEAKAQRTKPGYVPETELELAEWVRERVAIPEAQWFADVPVPAAVSRIEHEGTAFLVHEQVDLREDEEQRAAEVLQFYGPKRMEELAAILPFDNVQAIVDTLVGTESVVVGPLVRDSDETWYCDAENLETLIRFQRAAGRAAIEPKPITDLSPFIAAWQRFGLETNPGSIIDCVERLSGYAAPVAFWEEDAWLPRLPDLSLDDLENAAAEDGICWRGTGKEAMTVTFIDEPAPAPPPDGEDDETRDVARVVELFRDPNARYTFLQLYDSSGQGIGDFNKAFWAAAWGGQIGCDGFRPLFMARKRNFAIEEGTMDKAADAPSRLPGTRRRHARSGATARALFAAKGWPGTWYRTPANDAEDESLAHGIDALEHAKNLARRMLDRYGIVTRELAGREGGEVRWAAIFPALRLMELSGEAMTGLFFEGLSGPQFATPSALRRFEQLDRSTATYWINALDPASPSGLGPGFEHVPHRRITNHLGYFEGKLAIVSENHARRLSIFLRPDDPGLDALLPFLSRLAQRGRRSNMETINDEPARTSPYLPALRRHVTVLSDHRGVYFEAKTV